MKRLLPTVSLCVLLTVPAFAAGLDSDQKTGTRLRDRLIRIIRVITTGDGLQPPVPAPKP